MTSPPPRGFDTDEFVSRARAAQTEMANQGLSALLLTREPEVRYYSGFLTRFWESPTRPWFVVLPATGKPIAVIPSIGAHLMAQTWLSDIRTWQSPNYEDDGISLLADTLREVTPKNARIGLADHVESHVQMPLASLKMLEQALNDRQLTTDGALTRSLRMVKSDAEVAKIRHAASIADRAFERVQEIASDAPPLSEVFRAFQGICLKEGADWVPYLAGGAAPGGYGDVISPATDRPLATGDVMMLDTGLVWDGYFCDFDRNFSIGTPDPKVSDGHVRLVEATQAAFEIARPGKTIADLFHAMDGVVNPQGHDMSVGRLGHGLGMQLTEWPSIIPADRTPLAPGMVLTLEPAVDLGGGKIMVHEENILVGPMGATYLSTPQPPRIRVI